MPTSPRASCPGPDDIHDTPSPPSPDASRGAFFLPLGRRVRRRRAGFRARDRSTAEDRCLCRAARAPGRMLVEPSPLQELRASVRRHRSSFGHTGETAFCRSFLEIGVQVSRWRGSSAPACPLPLCRGELSCWPTSVVGSLTDLRTSTSIVPVSPGAKWPGDTSSHPPKPAPPTGVKRHRSVSHLEVCTREGSDFLGTGLLEQGLEVRLRGLQSFMVDRKSHYQQLHRLRRTPGDPIRPFPRDNVMWSCFTAH
jgi:hypothetical protein